MPRLNSTVFQFDVPAPGAVRAVLSYPLPGAMPLRFVFDEASLAALLTPVQKTALFNVLAVLFARADTDAKAAIDAQRAALNTDP